MAKELPYFKFEPSEWTHGNIQMCSNDAKVSFIELCCLYWNRLGDCSVQLAIAISCNRNESLFNELVDCKIVKIKGSSVFINFLDVQLNEFNLVKKARAESGKKGGQKGGIRPIEERKKGKQIYILECWSNEERFYKIGTTSNCVSRRYSGKIQYEYKLVFQYFTDEYIDAENAICENLFDCEYKPKLNFAGQKECYLYSSSKQIERVFNDYFKFAKASLKRNESIREEEKREDKKYISVFTFDDFWKLYPKKVAKTKCKPKFNKLSESDKDKILETLKDFISYKPFANYIHPNPETYLNQKRWEDELPTTIKNNDGLKVGDIDPKSGRPIVFFTEDGRPVIKPNSDKPTHYNK